MIAALDLRILLALLSCFVLTQSTKAPSAIDPKLYDELHLHVVGGQEE